MLVPHFTPRISVAVRSPRLARTESFLAAAERCYIPEIDLDLTGRRCGDPAKLARDLAEASLAIRAIWLPDQHARRTGHRYERLPDLVGRLADELRPGSVLIDRPHNRADARQASLLNDIRANIPPTTRIVYVIRPGSLAGTRDHLADLTALRRYAEEWDLELALDLHGPIDPKWEAEAAITKLRSRLSVVRFGPLASRPPGRGRERATARVIATLADGLFPGVIAISPQVRHARFPTTSALAGSIAETVGSLRSRFAAVNAALPDHVHFEQRHPKETRKDGPGWR